MDYKDVVYGNPNSSVIQDNDLNEDLNALSKEINEADEVNEIDYDIPLVSLTLEEKICVLSEIEAKLKKILYVYDESQKPNSNYNYKVYVGGVLIYVSSSNMLLGGELTNVIVNLNAITTNNFSKAQIKRLVFESKNFIRYTLSNYKKELDGKNINAIEDL